MFISRVILFSWIGWKVFGFFFQNGLEQITMGMHLVTFRVFYCGDFVINGKLIFDFGFLRGIGQERVE